MKKWCEKFGPDIPLGQTVKEASSLLEQILALKQTYFDHYR